MKKNILKKKAVSLAMATTALIGMAKAQSADTERLEPESKKIESVVKTNNGQQKKTDYMDPEEWYRQRGLEAIEKQKQLQQEREIAKKQRENPEIVKDEWEIDEETGDTIYATLIVNEPESDQVPIGEPWPPVKSCDVEYADLYWAMMHDPELESAIRLTKQEMTEYLMFKAAIEEYQLKTTRHRAQWKKWAELNGLDYWQFSSFR